jgi:hypothetical protein
MKNLFKKFAILSLAIIVFGCSKDETPTPTPANYSILGIWKTTSGVKNGVEMYGGSNIIKSEATTFYSNGFTQSLSFSDSNFSTRYSSLEGTYVVQNSNINFTNCSVYNANNTLTAQNVSLNGQIILLTATELQIKILNYPNTNDIYIKKYVRL